jgi:hypothetical protein
LESLICIFPREKQGSDRLSIAGFRAAAEFWSADLTLGFWKGLDKAVVELLHVRADYEKISEWSLG